MNLRPLGYEPSELPLLHPTKSIYAIIAYLVNSIWQRSFGHPVLFMHASILPCGVWNANAVIDKKIIVISVFFIVLSLHCVDFFNHYLRERNKKILASVHNRKIIELAPANA